MPPSLPWPDSLTPPNGVSGVEMAMELTPTMPDSSASPTAAAAFKARPASLARCHLCSPAARAVLRLRLFIRAIPTPILTAKPASQQEVARYGAILIEQGERIGLIRFGSRVEPAHGP